MKSTELMLNNWVGATDLPAFKVLDIHGESGNVYDQDGNPHTEESLIPLPITDEFLVLNKFRKFTTDEYWMDRPIHYAAYGKVTIKPTGVKSCGVLLWDLELGCLSHGEGRVFIQYVHELQQVLRLYGFEKKEIVYGENTSPDGETNDRDD
jgi:hypothetical protein